MKGVLKYSYLLLFIVLWACSQGGGEEHKTSDTTDKKPEVITPDTIVAREPEVARNPAPEPDPEPITTPTADPDFAGTLSDSLQFYRVEFLPDTAGLQYIRENVLVRVDISENQIDKLKSNSPDPDDFYIPADDNLFYMSQLSEKAEALGIKVINAKERYLGFLGINSSVQELYDLEKDSLPGVYWTFIAFNTTRGAKEINSIVDADMEKLAQYISKDAYPAILLQDTALWNLPTSLAAQDSISDTDFWQFLEDYASAQTELNNRLYDHPEMKYYDQYTLTGNREQHPLELILARESAKKGYPFQKSAHGQPFLGRSADFVRIHHYPRVTDTMREFLDIFLLMYTDDYWDEGSLWVEPIEIARHIVLWERFAEKYPDFIAPDYATNEARVLVSYLIDDGVSYNPYFSREDSTLEASFVKGMEYLISEAPETTSGRQIAEYYQLLEASQFKRTDTVANCLKAYRKARNALVDQ